MTTEQAVKAVEEFLQEVYQQEYPDSNPTKIELITWPTDNRHEATGLRVAEVSFYTPNPTGVGGGGFTYMQVDIEGAAACFFAERVVIAIAEEWPEEEILSEKWRLIFTVFGEDQANKYVAFPETEATNP